MCGISVYIQGQVLADEAVRNFVKNAATINYERGPDNFEYVLLSNDRVLMTHNRLSLVDLSEAGNQPMEKHGRTIVFNGEIYNFRNIRHELESKGYDFSTQTDTEVILSAFDYWGENCLEQFNGAFSFALHDPLTKTVFIARDRVGEKPLYLYRHADNSLMFASSLRQIMYSFNREWKTNKERVVSDIIFNFWSDKRQSHIKDIVSVDPGTYVIVSLDSLSCHARRYWSVPDQTDKSLTGAVTIESIKQLLGDSIAIRKDMDAPYGIALSGGLDSTLMTELARNASQARKVYTLHRIGHTDEDSKFVARYVAGKKDIELRLVNIADKDMSVNSMIRTTYYMEEPLLDFVYMYIARNYEQAHRDNMKAMLNGQGADELFLGYLDYYSFLRDARNYKDPTSFADMWNKSSEDIASVMPAIDREEIIKNTLARNYSHDKDDPLNGVLRFGIKTHLPALLAQEDKQSMRWSVECRTCYTDYRIVELAAQMPSKFKMLDNKEKYPLRSVAKEYIPEYIINREKLGFPSLADPKEDLIAQCLKDGILSDSKFIRDNFSEDIHDKLGHMPFAMQWKLVAIALFDIHFVAAINEDVHQRLGA